MLNTAVMLDMFLNAFVPGLYVCFISKKREAAGNYCHHTGDQHLHS